MCDVIYGYALRQEKYAFSLDRIDKLIITVLDEHLWATTQLQASCHKSQAMIKSVTGRRVISTGIVKDL